MRFSKKEYDTASKIRKRIISNYPTNLLFRQLTDSEILVIIQTFLVVEKELKMEEEMRQKKEREKKIILRDIGWFAGDCYD